MAECEREADEIEEGDEFVGEDESDGGVEYAGEDDWVWRLC